jgi:molybdenum cofactor guanylyltransferase/molybdopterin-guanine dinucleotide biosynthesis protein MobB
VSAPGKATGLILAGGRGARLGGADKGLVLYQGRPLIEHVIERLRPQVDALLISANRNADRYSGYGVPVVRDAAPTGHAEFAGPLAGMLAALRNTTAEVVLVVPCDAPRLPTDLARRLDAARRSTGAPACYAHDGRRGQFVFALLSTTLRDALQTALASGERKVEHWFAQIGAAAVDFSDQPGAFANLNTATDLGESPAIPTATRVPVLGFAGFSGAGKTTLLAALLPLLVQRGVRVGAIKHAHHRFDIDQPGKDSYVLRKAGAHQMLIASSQRWALMSENETPAEPRLADLMDRLDASRLDLVIVEGFKHEKIPKLEVHRPALQHPLLANDDRFVVAVACDAVLNSNNPCPQLDLNNPVQIADFIQSWLQTQARPAP